MLASALKISRNPAFRTIKPLTRLTRTMAKHARSPSQDAEQPRPKQTKGSKVPPKDPMLKHPTAQRAREIDADPPLAQLTTLLSDQTSDRPVRNVLHWFRSKDIRQEDNRALHAAAQKAREGKGTLLTMYLYSPKDLEWHGTSPARSDFLLESLRILREQLHAKDIPLAIVTAEERNQKVDKVVEFVKANDVSHVFANYEYEVDELRRDIKAVKHLGKAEVGFEVLHDQTVVEPGTIRTGAGTPAKVFTPYHKSWLAELAGNPDLLDLVPPPEANDKKVKEEFKTLFEGDIPALPEDKTFKDDEERDRIRKLWPAGHDAGMARLEDFLHRVRNLCPPYPDQNLLTTPRSVTTPPTASTLERTPHPASPPTSPPA